MFVKVEDFAKEIYEEFKDRIPGFTVRKAELMLKNSFFCMGHHFARMHPMQFGEVSFQPDQKYCALVQNSTWVVPQKNHSWKRRQKKLLEQAEIEFKKSLEISD